MSRTINPTTAPIPAAGDTAPQDPPMSSLASERMLLCAALTESRANVLRDISASVSADDFVEETHQNIWRIRTALEDAGVAHDLTSVLASSARSGSFIGGTDYVLGIARDEVIQAASDLAVRAAAKRVRELSVLRGLTKTLESAVQLAYSGLQSPDSIVDMVGDAVENVKNTSQTRATTAMHVEHYVAAVIEQVDTRASGAVPENVVTTGFSALDQLIEGFADSDLIVLAARPSMGKTAISLAIAEAAAQMGRRNVLYFSTEQSGNALTYRALASASHLDATRLRRGELSDDDFGRLVEGAQKIGNLNLYIDETSELTLPDLRARARIFAGAHEKPMAVVDYMQRMAPHRQADSRTIVGEISTGLKNLAKELKMPVIALAQLNRGPEGRPNKRPMMSDLGESGKIEQDADIILFLYRDEYYNKDTKEPGITEVIVGKNRDGSVGVVKLAFNARQQRYEDIQQGYSNNF